MWRSMPCPVAKAHSAKTCAARVLIDVGSADFFFTAFFGAFFTMSVSLEVAERERYPSRLDGGQQGGEAASQLCCGRRPAATVERERRLEERQEIRPCL